MEPLISLVLADPRREYPPGSSICFEYQIDAVAVDTIQAVEASVLWYTEGKGESDIGVHFFERRRPSDVPNGDLRPMHRVTLALPASPQSYDGDILKVRWCARVRVFLDGGEEHVYDVPFKLGDVPASENNGSLSPEEDNDAT